MRKLKLISILSVILIAMLSVCTVSYAQTYNDTEEVRALLKRIGVITAEDYNPDAGITRIEYLRWAIRSAKYNEDSYTGNVRQIFFDVPADDDNAPLVNLCYDLGIITGRADGRLSPNDNVTVEEAVIMAMRATGAGEVLKTSSNWVQAAITLDLLDKVKNDGGTITGATAERIIFNMLNAGFVQSDDGKTWYVDGGTTVLESKHNIEKATGIVDANSYASLYGGKGTLANQVSIDGNLYEIVPELDGRYLGENVTYYYEKDRYSGDVEQIIYMCSSRNQIIDMDIESAEALKALSFEYSDENGKTQDVELSYKAITLENGVKTTIPVSGYTLPKYGRIRLIDNNRDSEYDVVLVTNTEIRVINMFTNDVLYLSTSPSRLIKFEDYSKVVIKNKAGEILNTDALVAGSLVEITASSNKNHVEIVVLNDVVTLTIKSMEERDSNGYPVCYLTDGEGNTHRTVRDFESVYPDNKLVMGAEHNVLLNSNGHIAALAGDIVGGEMQYGYILMPYEKEPIGEGEIILRVLAADGNIVEYPVRKKVLNVTENTTITNRDILTLCAQKQLIRYGLTSEGYLNKIEFASNDSNSSGLRKGVLTGTTTDLYTRYYSYTYLIGTSIPIDKNTLLFLIPEDESDYSKYDVTNRDGLKNQGYYKNMQSYFYGDEFYAKALIYTSTAGTASLSKGDPRMIVSSISEVYDEAEDTTRPVLVGYSEGVEATFMLDSYDLLNWTDSVGNVRVISEGDSIRYSTNHKGKVDYIELVFDYSEKEIFTAPEVSSYTEATDYNRSAVHIYGQVAEKNENTYFRVIRDGLSEDAASSSYLYAIRKNVTFIYEYDSSKKRGQRIRNITYPEVMTLEDDPNLTDKVVIITQDYNMPFMVIYK